MDPLEVDQENESGVTKNGYTATVEEQAARDAMVKAATAAIVEDKGEEQEKPAPKPKDEEKSDDAKEKPKLQPAPKKPPAKEPDEKPMSAIARELARREEKRKVDSDYGAKVQEAEQTLSKVKQIAADLEQKERALAQKEREIAQTFDMIRQNPVEALRQFGWKPDQFIEASLNEKDPNYQRFNQLNGELQKRDQAIHELRGQVQQLMSIAKKYEEQGQQASQKAEVQQLFESIPEDSPVWADFDDEDDILYQANKVRRQYHAKTGRLASPKEIGEYLHYRALKRKGAPPETGGQKPKAAGKTKANGSRALGNDTASESRGRGGKAINDMDRDEEREFLIQVAEAAAAEEGG